MDPSPVFVVVVVIVVVVKGQGGAVPEEVGRIAMAGVEVELAAAAQQIIVVLDPRNDQAAEATEVVAME